MEEIVLRLKQKVDAFRDEAHEVLAAHEASPSRVISVDDTRKRLVGLSIQQQELLQESLVCVERGIYRAAHVMAWAGFIDFLEQKLASDGLLKVRSVRPAWAKYTTAEELRENVPEYQLIEVAHDVKLITKSGMRSLKGLLSKRNECAHPSSYKPGLNESLGYVSELLNRISQLQQKSL